MSNSAGDQRRSEILEAVVRVIIDIGFTDMTVADVAKAAGVSNALVHYHFTSKPALIEAALHVASLEDQQFRESIVAGAGSATARLDAMLCRSLPSDASDGSWLLWIETWGETRRNPGIRAVMADLDAHEVDAVVALIEEGNAGSEFRCDDGVGAAARLTALRDGLAIDRTLFHEHLAEEELVAQLRSAIRFNLGVSPSRYEELLGDDRLTT
jgi:AcrR family transcriptional regulator